MKILSVVAIIFYCAILHIAPTHAANAPKTALNAMPRGAISLKWEVLPRATNRNALALHVFCLPKGHSKEREQMLSEKRSGPIKRTDIDQGPSLEPSPFWFDVWTNTGVSNWTRLNRVAFTQTKDVQEIVLRWLNPQSKNAPFVAMHFGYTHWHEWETFTFPDGWSKPAVKRTFLWGGEGGSGVMQRFDQTRGNRMVIVETESEYDLDTANDKGKTETFIYRWNGREWLDATQKYFLIAATLKTRSEAQSWSDKHDWGEVLSSNDYPQLRRGYFIVVLDRFRSLKDANTRMKEIRLDAQYSDLKLYVRRAL